MTETPSSLPDQALRKLQKLVDGNGLKPEQIEVTLVEGDIYKIEGSLTLTPKCTSDTTRYPGSVRGKERVVLPNLSALRAEVLRRREEFENGGNWIETSIKELKGVPGQGWGLDNALVTETNKPVILASSGPCPQCEARGLVTCNQCHGQGTVICTLCHGRGQEVCPVCKGRGENPFQAGQPCLNCRGTRIAPCRQCQARGQMVCPTCGGRRGTPCPVCQATGKITEETTLTCGAETHFKLGQASLPSGARRGLDRLGLANLSKGHADINLLPAKAEDADVGPEKKSADKNNKKMANPVLHYEAQLPYADLKVSFGDKKAMIGAFGKHCVLLNVPNFLDDCLTPWRTKLKQATQDRSFLKDALEARAIHDTLNLELNGKANLKELRRLYPVGLSSQVAQEIIKNLDLAIKHKTFSLRIILSVLSIFLSMGVFCGLFFTPLYRQLAQNWSPPTEASFGILLPLVMLFISSFILITAVRFLLQKEFPSAKIALRQKIGKSGYAMLGLIVLSYIVILALSPTKPFWFLWLLAHVIK